MGFGSKTAKPKPSYTGVQLNTASSVLPIALAGGMSRMGVNLLDYVDFASHKQKVSGGKGFGGSATSFTYSSTIVAALCEGEISGVGQAWKDQGVEADYATFGFTLFTGAIPQAPWGYMVTAHADHARGYPGVAYLAKENMDLGASASLGNLSFEVQALFYNTGVGGTVPDADPALWTEFFLTDADKGAGFPPAQLDADALLSGPDAATTGDSAYQTYCQALGFAISPLLSEQAAASQHLDEVCTVTNTAAVWTGSALKLVPYGDQVVTANGVTFNPPTGVCYAFGDDDYRQQGDQDPVQATRSDPAAAKNIVNLVIRDRANAYNEVPLPWQDNNAVALYGPLPGPSVAGQVVCDKAMGGRMVALIGQRLLYTRNGYQWGGDPRHDRLEPMDVVTLTDSRMGLAALAVRITEIDEGDDDNLTFLAEQFSGTLGHPSDAATGTGATPTDVNSLAPPGPVNAPILFEPSAALAQRLFGSSAPCVIAAVSGGDGTTAEPHWGGCVVWLSTDAGTTYAAIGEIEGAARMGVSTAALAAYAGTNPDAVHTLSVSLLESAGDLAGVSSADAAAGVTLSYIDGEVLSFETATLTGPNAYDLAGELYRGQYGTAPGAHLTAKPYARLDGDLFHFPRQAAYVGVPLKLKFQSFNIWGQALEDLATCTAYDFTPTAAGFGGAAGGGTPYVDAVGLVSDQLVNIFDDAGTPSLRLADATVAGKEAHGFVKAGTAIGAQALLYAAGEVENPAWTLTTGLPVYLDAATPGGLTDVQPAASGNIVQPVGIATSATRAAYSYHPTADQIP